MKFHKILCVLVIMFCTAITTWVLVDVGIVALINNPEQASLIGVPILASVGIWVCANELVKE